MTSIAIKPKQTGGVVHRDASLCVGSKPNVFGNLMFDLTTYYGPGPAAIACVDLTRDEAEQVIAAIRQAFPAQAPKADIKLPDLYAVDVPVPTAVSVELDSRSLTLVNWLDFKGWEVRRRASRSGEAGLLLGYIAGSDGAWTVRATRPVPEQVSVVERVDEALRLLIKAANA